MYLDSAIQKLHLCLSKVNNKNAQTLGLPTLNAGFSLGAGEEALVVVGEGETGETLEVVGEAVEAPEAVGAGEVERDTELRKSPDDTGERFKKPVNSAGTIALTDGDSANVFNVKIRNNTDKTVPKTTPISNVAVIGCKMIIKASAPIPKEASLNIFEK